MRLNILSLSLIFIIAFVGLFGFLAFDMTMSSFHHFCLASVFSGKECPLGDSLIASVYHISVFDQLTQSILIFTAALSLFILMYFVVAYISVPVKLVVEKIKSVAIKVSWQFRFFKWLWLHEKRDYSLFYMTYDLA